VVATYYCGGKIEGVDGLAMRSSQIGTAEVSGADEERDRISLEGPRPVRGRRGPFVTRRLRGEISELEPADHLSCGAAADTRGGRIVPEDRTSLSSPGGIATSIPPMVDPTRADPSRIRSIVGFAVGVGLILCLGALIIGLRMALHATVVECPNGHEFPVGTTDFRCFAHEHAGDGTSIAIFAIVLGILLSLGGLVAQLVLPRPASR
jgi:hypothetical protein